MQPRPAESEARPDLPPPPAPIARDANPWPTGTADPAATRAGRHPRAGVRPPRVGKADTPGAGPTRRVPWIVLAVLFVIVSSSLERALRALEQGDVEAALVAFLLVVAVALFAVPMLLGNRKGRK